MRKIHQLIEKLYLKKITKLELEILSMTLSILEQEAFENFKDTICFRKDDNEEYKQRMKGLYGFYEDKWDDISSLREIYLNYLIELWSK